MSSPRVARAGSVGDAHYSPLVRVANRDDIVFNAPMIAFNVGPEKISFCGGNPDYSVVTDTVANICLDNGTVDLKLRFGCAYGKHWRYLSLDANSEESAALEASTFAPAGSDILQSGATEIIYAIVNGRTDQNEPERQGLNSALSGEGPSLDILASFEEISADDEVDGWRSLSRASQTRGPALCRRSVLSNGAVQRTKSLSTGGLTL